MLIILNILMVMIKITAIASPAFLILYHATGTLRHPDIFQTSRLNKWSKGAAACCLSGTTVNILLYSYIGLLPLSFAIVAAVFCACAALQLFHSMKD